MENEKAIKDLISIQQEIKKIPYNQKVEIKLKTGAKIKYEYADLPSVHAEIKPIVNKYNYFLSYVVDTDSISCTLTHVSGYNISNKIEFRTDNDTKSTGAKITYYKRYLVSALLGLDTDKDNEEQITDNKQKAKISEKAYQIAINRIKNGEKEVLNKCMKYFDLTQSQHDELLNLDLEYNYG